MSPNDAFANIFSLRCYAERALPAALYLALYACRPLEDGSPLNATNVPTRIQQVLLFNANLMGDNCHRGAILGMLIGLIFGAVDETKQNQNPTSDGITAAPASVSAASASYLQANGESNNQTLTSQLPLPPPLLNGLRSSREGEHAKVQQLFEQFTHVCLQYQQHLTMIERF